MKLTENFSLAELTKSQTAERKGIPNTPTKLQEQSLKLIAEKILIPNARKSIMVPMILSMSTTRNTSLYYKWCLPPIVLGSTISKCKHSRDDIL